MVIVLDNDLMDRWLRAKAEIDEVQTLRNEIKKLRGAVGEQDDVAKSGREEAKSELDDILN